MNKQLLSLIVVAAVACLCSTAQASDYVLMLQQTPVQAGTVSPGIGVHNVPANGAVTISATPKPGYQFVYWLGDVADSTAATTTVSISNPKIVIAVFERSEYELPFTPAAGESAGAGGDNLVRHNGESSPGQASAPGQKKYDKPKYPTDPDPKDPPVPDVPEPATVVLLGIGSLLAANRKKVK